MAFWRSIKTEFGKKTGKALGNKLYGAYADDRRVGVNRGKLKGESDGLKITSQQQIVSRQQQIESDNQQRQFEREMEMRESQIEREREMLDSVLNIELDPTNTGALIKSLTTLSVFVDMWAKESNPDEHFIAAKSKFDTGVAILQAVDPSNPMVAFFLQKQTDFKKIKQKGNMGTWLLIIGILIFLIVMYFIADKL